MGCCKAGMNPHPAITIALGWLGALTVLADEQPPVLQAGTDVYGNVAVPSLSATDVYFTYNNGRGMANAKRKHLSPELQKYFRYNPAAADKAEQEQIRANLESQQTERVKSALVDRERILRFCQSVNEPTTQ